MSANFKCGVLNKILIKSRLNPPSGWKNMFCRTNSQRVLKVYLSAELSVSKR